MIFPMLHFSNNLKEKKRNINIDLAVLPSHDKLALRSLEPAIHSSFSFCSHCHGLYYVALLGIVVISVLIWVPIATSAQTKLV